MQREFQTLRRILEERCVRGPVYYYPNPGNWGDSVIREGTEQFFEDIGLEPVRIRSLRGMNRLRTWLRKGVLVYGGGGAWCDLWGVQTRFIETEWRRFEHIIVLPSTYERSFPVPNVSYLCRDRFESLERAPGATFCHDMAFYLGAWPSEAPTRRDGYFFRCDKESLRAIDLPPDNEDLSARGSTRTPIEPFFEAVARCEVVHTDRLHVAIAACLLGRELHLHPGAYFKNRALFRSSVEGYFPNVHFHADVGAATAPKPSAQ